MTTDLERAVEVVSHQIAAGIHFMLAESKMTAAELKAALNALPDNDRKVNSTVVDDILAGTNPNSIKISILSDVAFVLGGIWDFSVTPAPTQNVAAQPNAESAKP